MAAKQRAARRTERQGLPEGAPQALYSSALFPETVNNKLSIFSSAFSGPSPHLQQARAPEPDGRPPSSSNRESNDLSMTDSFQTMQAAILPAYVLISRLHLTYIANWERRRHKAICGICCEVRQPRRGWLDMNVITPHPSNQSNVTRCLTPAHVKLSTIVCPLAH